MYLGCRLVKQQPGFRRPRCVVRAPPPRDTGPCDAAPAYWSVWHEEQVLLTCQSSPGSPGAALSILPLLFRQPVSKVFPGGIL